MLAIVAALLVVFVPLSQSYGVINGEPCSARVGCDRDPRTGDWAPIFVDGRNALTSSDPSWVLVDEGIQDAWAKSFNYTIVYRRPAANLVVPVLGQLFSSDNGPDVVSWNTAGTYTDSFMDLTNMSAQDNWTTRFSPRMMDAVTFNGKVVAVPDRVKFWGFWYKKSDLETLNMPPPNDWDSLILLFKAIKATGVVPLCLGLQDLWQGMTLWEFVSLQMGGAAYYDKLQTGKIDFSNDTIQQEVYTKLDELIPYLPPVSDLLADGLAGVATKWIEGKCMIMFDTSFNDVVPALFHHNNSDYDFFKVPIMNPNIPFEDTAQFSTYSVWAAKAITKVPIQVSNYLRLLASDNYHSQFLTYTAGAASALTSIRNLITDPVMLRGLKMLDDAPRLFNVIDAGALTPWTAVVKPIWTLYFTGQITAQAMLQSMELARREIVLLTVSPPTWTRNADDSITLQSATKNATIYYSLALVVAGKAEADRYVLYSGPIASLPGSVYRLRAYAQKELMKVSPGVEFNYATLKTRQLNDGDVMEWSYGASASAMCLVLVLIACVTVYIVDDAGRRQVLEHVAKRNKHTIDMESVEQHTFLGLSLSVLRWIMYGSLVYGPGIWAFLLMITWTVTWTDTQASMQKIGSSVASVLIMFLCSLVCNFFMIALWKSILSTNRITPSSDISSEGSKYNHSQQATMALPIPPSPQTHSIHLPHPSSRYEAGGVSVESRVSIVQDTLSSTPKSTTVPAPVLTQVITIHPVITSTPMKPILVMSVRAVAKTPTFVLPLLASLSVALGFFCAHLIVFQNIVVPYGILHVNAGIIIGALLFEWIVLLVSYFIYSKHAMPKVRRLILFSLSNSCGLASYFFLAGYAMVWRYDKASADLSLSITGTLDWTYLVLIGGFVVGAIGVLILCFLPGSLIGTVDNLESVNSELKKALAQANKKLGKLELEKKQWTVRREQELIEAQLQRNLRMGWAPLIGHQILAGFSHYAAHASEIPEPEIVDTDYLQDEYGTALLMAKSQKDTCSENIVFLALVQRLKLLSRLIPRRDDEIKILACEMRDQFIAKAAPIQLNLGESAWNEVLSKMASPHFTSYVTVFDSFAKRIISEIVNKNMISPMKSPINIDAYWATCRMMVGPASKHTAPSKRVSNLALHDA